MFRITSGKVPDELIRRAQAGVPVRLITDRRQDRNRDVLLALIQHRPHVRRGHSHQVESRLHRSGHASEIRGPLRQEHGRLRVLELDGVIVRQAARAQLLHQQVVVRRRGSPRSFFANGTTSGSTGPPSPRRCSATTSLAGQRLLSTPHRRKARSSRRALRYRSDGRAAGGRTNTTSTSVPPTRRRSWRRTTCPARRPLASVPPRNPSTPVRPLRHSPRCVPQGSRPGPRITG